MTVHRLSGLAASGALAVLAVLASPRPAEAG